MSTFKSIVFPTDLGTGITYPDIVSIEIKKKHGLQMNDFTREMGSLVNQHQSLAQSLDEALTPIAEGSGDRASESDENDKSLAERIAENPSGFSDSILNSMKSATAKFRKNVNRLTNANNPATPVGIIHLPMPENLQYNDTAEWQSDDLGMVRGMMKGTGSLEAAGFANMGSIISGGAGSLVSTVLGQGVIGGAVLGALGGGGLQSNIEVQTRLKANPFKEQTFQGVPFRAFEFSWTLSPRNKDESNILRDLIEKFRAYSKPSYQNSESFFEYPHDFYISFKTFDDLGQEAQRGIQGFLPDGTREKKLNDNLYLPKLKPCILKSVNTNFATSGWHSFDKGAPTSVTLQLQFEETLIVTQDDVLGGENDETRSEIKGGF